MNFGPPEGGWNNVIHLCTQEEKKIGEATESKKVNRTFC